MNTEKFLALLATMFFSTSELSAQQPRHRAPADSGQHGRMMMTMDMQQRMRMMDSLTAGLDTLVARMNRTTGNERVAAMAQVINELVAERHLMQKHMHQMMQSPAMPSRKMGVTTDSVGAQTRMPQPAVNGARADSADSGHAAHHQ